MFKMDIKVLAKKKIIFYISSMKFDKEIYKRVNVKEALVKLVTANKEKKDFVKKKPQRKELYH